MCRDIAKLDWWKLDFDPRLQEFFLASRGGGNTAQKNLSGAPGAQEGPPEGDPFQDDDEAESPRIYNGS